MNKRYFSFSWLEHIHNSNLLMIENFNPFVSLGGNNEKVNHMAEAALEMNLTCNDLKKDLNLSDGDVIDMLQLVMDGFKNRA